MLDDIERAAEMAFEMLDEAIEGMDKMLPKVGPGTHRPTSYELAMWVQEMTTQYPPVPMVNEDGTQVVASPYLLCLKYVEGGPALLKRIQGLFEEVA